AADKGEIVARDRVVRCGESSANAGARLLVGLDDHDDARGRLGPALRVLGHGLGQRDGALVFLHGHVARVDGDLDQCRGIVDLNEQGELPGCVAAIVLEEPASCKLATSSASGTFGLNGGPLSRFAPHGLGAGARSAMIPAWTLSPVRSPSSRNAT